VVNNDYTKEECESILAVPGYPKKLQDALIAEVGKVVQTEYNENYEPQYRPSIWCGSMIMQIVVETFASQLQEHYSSGNVLELRVDNSPLSFASLTTTAEPTPATTTATSPSETLSQATKTTTTTRIPDTAPISSATGFTVTELAWIIAAAAIGLLGIFAILAALLKLRGRPRSDSDSSNASGVRVVVGKTDPELEMTSLDSMSDSHSQSSRLIPKANGPTEPVPSFSPMGFGEAPADSEIAAIETKISQMSPAFRRVPTWASMRRMLEDNPDNIATFKRHIREAAIIVDYQVLPLIDNFVIFMRNYGSATQKRLYSSLDYAEVLDRLVIKRPAVFLNAGDSYVLKSTATGQSDFETIGGDDEIGELKLESLMCYDEIAIAALLSMGGPTQFLNSGNRYNDGYWNYDGDHVKEGIYVGCVGARFERPLQMEWRHMIVEEFQNTKEKGYGPKATGHVAGLLRAWAKLYGVAHFPLWSDVHQEGVTPDVHVQNRYWLIPEHEDRGPVYFDSHVYRARMRLVIAPFLCYADEEASKRKTKAYVHVVGLGLGAWLVHKSQPQEQVEIFAEILRSERFQYIADIDFSWFADVTSCGGRKNGELIGGVKIHFSKRDPADPLTGPHANKLLVAQYAWDGNAFPGNEYWTGLLNASGDPAAAASSTIGLIHNCEFNTGLTSDAVRTYEFPGYVSRGGPYTYKDKLHTTGNDCDAYHSSMQGYRQNQEDAHCMHATIPDLPGCSLFAVLDGHGGDQISFHGGNILLEHVAKTISVKDLSPEVASKGLEKAYMDVDEHLKELTDVEKEKSGCTAITALITPDHIIVANCGDSRCVLSRNSEAIALSEDQKATSPVEMERIKKAGGVVFMKRVNGDLAVARAFGDWRFKQNDKIPAAEQMVSAHPVVTPIVRSEDDDFLVLACDGVWDVMSNEEVVSFVCERLGKNEEPGDVADALLDLCLKKRSRDNMTAIIVLLNVKLNSEKKQTGADAASASVADAASASVADAASASVADAASASVDESH